MAPQRFRLEFTAQRLVIRCLQCSAAEAVDEQRLIAGLQLSAQRGFPGQPPLEQLRAHHTRQAATAERWRDPFALTEHQQVGTVAATEVPTGIAQQC